MGDQRDQQVESAATNHHHLIVGKQQAIGAQQLETAKPAIGAVQASSVWHKVFSSLHSKLF
jgi:hypothetical protein